MRKLLVAFVTVAIPFVSANAQDASRRPSPPPKPKAAEVAPVKAKPVEKPGNPPEPKRSFINRLFGPKPTPPPPPPPAPTPAPKVKSKRPKRPVEAVEKPEPAHIAKPNPAPETETKPEGEPADAPPAEKPADANPETTPPAPEGTPAEAATEPPKTTGKKDGKKSTKPPVPALDDATKYKNAKATATEDAAIKELKTKADSAVQESEAHEASVAYNRALFRKVRQIDPSLDKYVDGIEAAMMKRLSAEKKGE